MSDFDMDDVGEGEDLSVCSECGADMEEDEGDPSMMTCQKCGHTASTDELKDQDTEEME